MSEFDLAWDDIETPSQVPSVAFLKLEVGDKGNRIRIVSLPSKISVHWEEIAGGGKRKFNCPGAKCPLCNAGRPIQTRFQMLVLDKGTKEYDVRNKAYLDVPHVKVLETGSGIIQKLKALANDEENGDPTKYDIKIIKSGSGKQTKYDILPTPNKTELTAEEQNAVNNSPSIKEINPPSTVDQIMNSNCLCLKDNGANANEEATEEKPKSKDAFDDFDGL